jgi:hypothetical protein
VAGNLDTLHTAVTAAATRVGNQIAEHINAAHINAADTNSPATVGVD